MYATPASTVPLYYENQSLWYDTIAIVKNNSGLAYLPEYDFNGVGNIRQFEGYQIKNENSVPVYLKYSGNIIFDSVNNTSDVQYTYGTTLTQNNNVLANGWNLVSLPSIEPIDCAAYFQPFLDEGILVIVKRYDGTVYLPEFTFNGIGNMIPGECYLLKIDV